MGFPEGFRYGAQNFHDNDNAYDDADSDGDCNADDDDGDDGGDGDDDAGLRRRVCLRCTQSHDPR